MGITYNYQPSAEELLCSDYPRVIRVASQALPWHIPKNLYFNFWQNRGHTQFKLSFAEERIDRISIMPENWDGYGAISISQETARNAKHALKEVQRFAPLPDITPNPNGTISFEWESSEGFGHLEIGQTRYSFYIKQRTLPPISSNGQSNQIDDSIGKLVSNMLFPALHSTETITKMRFTFNV